MDKSVFERIYEVVKQIPRGKVATQGGEYNPNPFFAGRISAISSLKYS